MMMMMMMSSTLPTTLLNGPVKLPATRAEKATIGRSSSQQSDRLGDADDESADAAGLGLGKAEKRKLILNLLRHSCFLGL
jgi:hypothetical protein